MKLKGNKVYIRPPKINELSFIKELWTDPKTMQNVGGIVEWDDHKMKQWYKKMVQPGDDKNFYFLIFNLTKEPVGEVSLHRFDRNTGTADLNIKIKYKYRGNGYAREALFLLLDFFFNKFGGEIVQDRIAANNLAGQNFLEDFDFTQYNSDCDVNVFKLTKEEFNRR